MKMNINEDVKVKLTESGKVKFREYLLDTYNADENVITLYKPDINGYTIFQLWDFMRIFGPHMYVGGEALFEENDVYIEN